MHTYLTRLRWDGSTGDGIRSYSRHHTVAAPPALTALDLSADAAFRGDAGRLNPEQLVVAAASSCQMLSFLGAAARAGVDVHGYEDEATSRLELSGPAPRLGPVRIAVTVRVADGTDPEVVRALADQAHRECYVANSLSVPVEVRTTVVTA